MVKSPDSSKNDDASASRRLELASGRRIALVPTMGALHEGHRELIRHARRMPGAGVVAVSIFVNPLQFGPKEDFHRYPRPFAKDAELCRKAGVDAIYHPSVAAMYPKGSSTTIAVEDLPSDEDLLA